ncbi:hypothetical protein CPB83DRAFT_892227 [Crepidotus variabilis]|uniref:Uncharacterized protein n=1 Tax=Crepidotus variabilis TaxID=179855 RepID=A0A9P6JS51_9AGAR|nr:hypothetical protein CPB83DRAFT_892227 [Crepidotus variabilis]
MSSKFTKIFNGLPLEAQQLLVEKHLAGLLDAVPKDKAKKAQVITAATRLQTKYEKAPQLDLRSKRKQIGDLLDELARDAKTSMIKERSNRDELLSEIVHSLVSWLNDIWSVVYEHNAHFLTAHTCLLFTADALAQLSESSTLGGCKCSVMNLPVEFTLKDKNGKTLRRFSLQGPQNVDKALLWIWRDLFVSLFLKGSEKDKARVPDLLEEIQVVLGVEALEKILYGGAISEDNDEEWEDEDYDPAEDEDLGDYAGDCFDDNSDYDTEESDSRCSCNRHANYWTDDANHQRIPLRDCVEKQLMNVFRETPSLGIFNSLATISGDPIKTEKELMKILEEVAGSTPDNLVAALEIHISNNNYSKIVALLDEYSYLLRPRDMTTLVCAVTLLDESSFRGRALFILEKELEDSLGAIYHSIRASFTFIEDEPNKQELKEILKLKSSSSSRKARVEAWAETVISSPGNPMHPMAFAAMMMGLPMIPGVDDGEDSDILNYVDLDQNDPDFEDLREEYRPNLKARFDGWTNLGSSLNGGPAVLAKLYQKAVEIMPFLQGQDIVNEMAARSLRERPNKTHILDALNNLSTFAKTQRKKLSLARGEKKRTTTTTTTIHPGRSPQSSSSATPFNIGSSSGSGSSQGPNGMPPGPPNAPAHPQNPFATLVLGVGPGGQLQFGAIPPPPPPPGPPGGGAGNGVHFTGDFPLVPGGMEDVD